MERRELLKTAIAGAAGIVLGAPFLRAQGAETVKLADNLFIVKIPGEANAVVQTSAAGVLLVDGASTAGSDALLKAVAALPGAGKVQTLFNTHWHPEQTGSNESLGIAGATIIAQENTRLWLTQNITWPWNRTEIQEASQDRPTQQDLLRKRDARHPGNIRYGYISDAAHTDGDLYVYFPQQNVLAVGGAVYGQGWPVVDWWTGGWIGGIVGGLQRIQTVASKDGNRYESFPPSVPCSAWTTSPSRSTCTARSTIA